MQIGRYKSKNKLNLSAPGKLQSWKCTIKLNQSEADLAADDLWIEFAGVWAFA